LPALSVPHAEGKPVRDLRVANRAHHRHRDKAQHERRQQLGDINLAALAVARRRLSAQVHVGQQRHDNRQKQIACELGHGRRLQDRLVVVDLLVGQRRADYLRGLMDCCTEKQPNLLGGLQDMGREVRVQEHAQQPEQRDVRHGVGDLFLLRLDGRRDGHNRRYAADACACGNQRAQPLRQVQTAVNPHDENQPAENRRRHHRNAPRAQLEHIQQAKLDADQDNPQAQNLRRAELDALLDALGQRQQVAQQDANHDYRQHGGNRAGLTCGVNPLQAQHPRAEHVGQRDGDQHNRYRQQKAWQNLRHPAPVWNAQQRVQQPVRSLYLRFYRIRWRCHRCLPPVKVWLKPLLY
jgi:hypothetical protein